MFSKFIFLFRIFFPSWKFFDESSYLYYLKFRYCKEGEDITLVEWQFCPPKLNRTRLQLLINPDGNIALACESTLQLFYSDLYERQNANNTIDLTGLTSYKNIQNLVQYFARLLNDGFGKYQFKVLVINEKEIEEDIIVSVIHSRDSDAD